jgi:hypothetical protein
MAVVGQIVLVGTVCLIAGRASTRRAGGGPPAGICWAVPGGADSVRLGSGVEGVRAWRARSGAPEGGAGPAGRRVDEGVSESYQHVRRSELARARDERERGVSGKARLALRFVLDLLAVCVGCARARMRENGGGIEGGARHAV